MKNKKHQRKQATPSGEFRLFHKVDRVEKMAERKPKLSVIRFILQSFDDTELVELSGRWINPDFPEPESPHPQAKPELVSLIYKLQSIFFREESNLSTEDLYGQGKIVMAIVIYEITRRRGCFENLTFDDDPFYSNEWVRISGPNLPAIRETVKFLREKGISVPPELNEESPEFARLLGVGGKPSGITF